MKQKCSMCRRKLDRSKFSNTQWNKSGKCKACLSTRKSTSASSSTNTSSTKKNTSAKQAKLEGYLCNICKIPGHWMENCPLFVPGASGNSKLFNSKPSDGYLCKLCHTPGHWMENCTKYKERHSAHNQGNRNYNHKSYCKLMELGPPEILSFMLRTSEQMYPILMQNCTCQRREQQTSKMTSNKLKRKKSPKEEQQSSLSSRLQSTRSNIDEMKDKIQARKMAKLVHTQSTNSSSSTSSSTSISSLPSSSPSSSSMSTSTSSSSSTSTSEKEDVTKTPWQEWSDRHFKITGMTETEKTDVGEVVKRKFQIIAASGKIHSTDWSTLPLLLPPHLLEQQKIDSRQSTNPIIVNKMPPVGPVTLIRVPTDAATIEIAVHSCTSIRHTKGNVPITIQLDSGEYSINSNWINPSDQKTEVNSLDLLLDNIKIVGDVSRETLIRGSFFIHNHYGIELHNLTVSNKEGYGIWVHGPGSTVKAVNCKFDQCKNSAAYIDGGSAFDATNCHFANSSEYGCGATINDLESTGRFVDCKFYSNRGWAGIWVCDGAIVDLFGESTEVYNNHEMGMLATHKDAVLNVHLPESHNTSHNNAENGDGAPDIGKSLLIAMAPMFNAKARQGGMIKYSCGKIIESGNEEEGEQGCVIS